MRLSGERIKELCRHRSTSLSRLLAEASVSRTAYYSLLRRRSVVPGSVAAIARHLGVPMVDLLEMHSPAERAMLRLTRARELTRELPDVPFDTIWHTLTLLDEPPIDRLNRSLLRGRTVDLHG